MASQFESIDDGPYRLVMYQDTYTLAVKRGIEWIRLAEGHIDFDEEDKRYFLQNPPECLGKRYLEALEDRLNEKYAHLKE